MSSLQIVKTAPGWVEATWQNVFFLYHFAGTAEDSMIHEMVRNMRGFSRQQQNYSICLVTGDQARPPSANGRSELKNHFRANQDSLSHVAIWIRRGGLLGSVLRSAATGVFMLGAPWLRAEFVSNTEQLVAWLMSNTGSTEPEAKAALSELLTSQGQTP